MKLIDLVAVATVPSPLSSPEFLHGWQQLRRITDPNIPWIETTKTGAQALELEVIQSPVSRELPDSAHALLLAHGQVLLTRSVLAQLVKTLDSIPDATAIHAFDSGYPPPLPPDYCTLRGMERFLGKLAQETAIVLPDHRERRALVTLTTLGAIRKGRVLNAAFWAQSAYVHDFSNYHQAQREDVIPLIPKGARKLLDVGGGEGGFLVKAKEILGCETHLAEFSVEACRIARPSVDYVWQGDFLIQNFASNSQSKPPAFDCITFLDVLEHTSDPQEWLSQAKTLLADGGVVIASIPNVAHWGVIADLLEGRWDYCPVGVHCSTHLRFFTEHSIRDLFDQCGYEIERIECVKVPCPASWSEHWMRTPGLQSNLESWDNYAFLVISRPRTVKVVQ